MIVILRKKWQNKKRIDEERGLLMLFNVRSVYSLLNSTLRLEDYVKNAYQLGYSSLGLADEVSLQGAYQFYQLCLQHQIKPLLGLQLMLPGVYRTDRQFPLLVYACNYQGYQELMQVVHIDSLGDGGRVWQYLKQAQHLIYMSVGHYSELEQCLLQENIDEALKVLQRLQAIFDIGNVYLGISGYPFNQLELVEIRQFAKNHHLPCVMCPLINTLVKDDHFSLKVLRAIAKNEQVDLQVKGLQSMHYLMPYEELQAMYLSANLQEVILETQQLVERLSVTFPQHTYYLPSYATPQRQTAAEYLRQLTVQRLTELLPQPLKVYEERLDYELSVINKLGFADYFLIVWDIVAYCREKGIRIGPGRGSAAGSLVSYLLRITGVDPIHYQLLFERFLNPERYNMPDIDLDIPDNRRQEVLQYIVNKYGHEHVAQIATIGTFGARQAMRDVLRVMGATTDTLRRWANAIPKELDMTLAQAYQQSPALRQLVEETQEEGYFQVAQTIEGLPRNFSTHAAAVVIHDRPLAEMVPVIERKDQPLMTQFTMYDVEAVGLLKMDFLGLRNLSLLDRIVRRVKKEEPQFELEAISMEDQSALALFRRAETNGIFQFESDGIRQVLRKLQPERFEDIVAVNALFRPGPMKQIDHYVARRHGRETYTSIHPIVETILAPTYGIMVYQEQVMQVCQAMAGFTLGEADLLRRAMGKKQLDVMASERERFVVGALKQGIEESTAQATYDYIIEFASYGFNRSHAVVYSTLAYQLAYLKAHYPLQFFQALLNSGASQQVTLNRYIREATRLIGAFLPVDMNESHLGFAISENTLRVGFETIKGLRRDFCEHIIDNRQLMGPYTSLQNFMQRLPKNMLKDEWIEPLIKVGAFDFSGVNRPTLLKNLAKLRQNIEFSGGSTSLFPEMEPKIEWLIDWSEQTKNDHEQELLGFSFSPHPLQKYSNWRQQQGDLVEIGMLPSLAPKTKIHTVAQIQNIKLIQTKRQEPMAFIQLVDESASIDGVVFPAVYQQIHRLLKTQEVVDVYGQIDLDRAGRPQLIIQKLQMIELGVTMTVSRCFIRVENFKQFEPYLETVKAFAHRFAGPVPIILVDANKQSLQLDIHYNIAYTSESQKMLSEILSDFSIVFR